jgi:hypothetical protein
MEKALTPTNLTFNIVGIFFGNTYKWFVNCLPNTGLVKPRLVASAWLQHLKSFDSSFKAIVPRKLRWVGSGVGYFYLNFIETPSGFRNKRFAAVSAQIVGIVGENW